MEIGTLTSRSLTTDAEWAFAARLKREKDYASVVAGIGPWSEPEVHALYQERWGEGEAEYQLGRLREESKGGELRGWFAGDEMVAFATLRQTNLLADEGPKLLIVSQLYVVRSDMAIEVAMHLAALADERRIEESDLTLASEHLPAFETAGFAIRTVTMRRLWQE